MLRECLHRSHVQATDQEGALEVSAKSPVETGQPSVQLSTNLTLRLTLNAGSSLAPLL